MPSASVGTENALYEPIHGSFPQATGLGIANPLATVLSAAMLFEMSFGLTEEGATIRKVVDQSLADGKVTEDLATPGQTALSTSEVGDYLVSLLQ
ncbi:MAG: 3-isopropylmalate dehydrogenase, partial [Flavobacteriaceae bacterium]|nr:3-isopropylmalate dehydrogenase [Flavobacteriaceae bacterium]